MPTIGLTGNFGMGKSTVLKLFLEMGAFTFDTDSFVHAALGDPRLIRRIVTVLGRGILAMDSALPAVDKKAVAEIIFSNPRKRRAVEAIIHPEVLKAIKSAESETLMKDPSAVIVFEVPLLYEAGYEKYFDKTIVVHTKRSTALDRLKKRGFSRDHVLARTRSQMPITEKKKRADFLINNDADMQNTERQVRRIYNKISSMISG